MSIYHFHTIFFSAITLTLATFLMAAFAQARMEYYLQCSKKEMGVRWPSYLNSGDYYVCQHENGMLMKLSCVPGELFSFVLQICTSPNKFIPPPPFEALPTGAVSNIPSHHKPHHNVYGGFDGVALPKPYSPNDLKPSPNLPHWSHLPHLPNGPQPPTVDIPTDVFTPPSVNEFQPPSQALPVPPSVLLPQPPSSSVVQPQPPTIVIPPSGVPQPPAKPVVPLPPTPAPTPTLIKVTPAVPVKVPMPPTSQKKKTPPISQKKKTPPVSAKVKKN